MDPLKQRISQLNQLVVPPCEQQLLRFKRTLLPAFAHVLRKIFAALLRTRGVSIPVFLSCMKLSYFFAILFYRWGLVLARTYALELQMLFAKFALRFFQNRIGQSESSLSVLQMLDDVHVEQLAAFDINTPHNTLDQIEGLLPVASIIQAVKAETNTEEKIAKWTTILVNTISQVVLIPYVIGVVYTARCAEDWAKLQCASERSMVYEMDSPAKGPRVDAAQGKLNERLAEAMEFLLPHFTAVVRHTVTQCLQESWDKPRAARMDVPEEEVTEGLKAALRASISRADISVMVESIRMTIIDYMPYFAHELGALREATELAQLSADLKKNESFLLLRSSVIESTFRDGCVPFLEKCAEGCASYSAETDTLKFVHFCTAVSAHLHSASRQWIQQQDNVHEFFTNITEIPKEAK